MIYPGILDEGEMMEWVERFYDEYYFRPKAAWRIVRKAIFDGPERKRLYKEAKEYMSLRDEAQAVRGGSQSQCPEPGGCRLRLASTQDRV